jgi:hypothetical protein
MLDGLWTISCFRHSLEDVLASDFAELTAVVLNQGSEAEAARRIGRARRYWNAVADARSRRGLAYTLYTRFVDRLPENASDPLRIVDCRDLLADVPVLPVTPATTRFVHRFPPDAVQAVRELDLDVLVRFGFNIVRGEILDVPRYGIWSYHHGDPDQFRGGPAHFWEIVEGNPVSGAMLQVLTDELDGGLVLCKGLFTTTPTLSVAVNRYGPYWGTQHFLIQKLNELHRFGWDFVRGKALPPEQYRGRRSPYRTPTNTEFLGWAAREVGRRGLRRLARADTETDWNVGIRRTDVPLPSVQRPDAAIGEFKLLANPPGRFLADPFLLADGADTWMFVEDYAFDTRRGIISCGRVTPDGDLADLRPCLERPHHLSYPHVFRHEGDVYMVPESEASGTVDLYRATRFPDEWVRERTLLELRCVDPTLFRHEGCWYMYVTHTAVRGQDVMTLLFEAPRLHGPWTLHRASPVSSDVRHSRSAGPIVRLADRLLRPAQNCTLRYGRALVFNEIEHIGPEAHVERPVREIDSSALPGFDGLHHFHAVGPWEVIDVRRQVSPRVFAVHPAREPSGALPPTTVTALR